MLQCQSDPRKKKELTEVTNFIIIINEQNRLKILCFLRDEEKCVCEIWKSLGLPQNLTSHHLKTLKDFGLITSKKEGRKIIYSVHKKNVQKYTKLLNNFLSSKL